MRTNGLGLPASAGRLRGEELKRGQLDDGPEIATIGRGNRRKVGSSDETLKRRDIKTL